MNPLEKLEADPSSSPWLRKAAGEAMRMPMRQAVSDTHALAQATLQAHNELIVNMAELPQNKMSAQDHNKFPAGRWT
jgi:hypothetical protein